MLEMLFKFKVWTILLFQGNCTLVSCEITFYVRKRWYCFQLLSNQVIEECKSCLWLDMPDNSNWQPIPFTFPRICAVWAISEELFSHPVSFSPLWRDSVEQCGPGHLNSSEFLQIWVILLVFLKWKLNFRMIFRIVSRWRMLYFTCSSPN